MRSIRLYENRCTLRAFSRIRLCGSLCDLGASVVSAISSNSTTETQSFTESAQRNPFPIRLLVAIALAISLSASAAFAQTSSFTYQGRLTDGGTAANGNYDLQFALFDSLSGGAQIGATQTINTVLVTNGVFTVNLEFGAGSFPGADRFLEISTRASGVGSFTPLTPRQQVTATPYAIRSVNASAADALSSACASCVQDAQINSVSGSKVSGAVASATNATNATNATSATNAT